LSKGSAVEEIERLGKEIAQKEQDYQTVVEVGKLLLEKNKEMTDNQDALRKQFEIALRERDEQLKDLKNVADIRGQRESELQTELQNVKLVRCLVPESNYLLATTCAQI
jgi:hypothetical protein